jgi:ATP-dependent DNA helicase PIF1
VPSDIGIPAYSIIQNISKPPELSEKLVNGSLGKVVEFISIEEAVRRNIPRAGEDPKRPTSVHALNASARPNTRCRPMTGHMFSQRQVWPVIHFPGVPDIPFVLVIPLKFTVEGFTNNMEGSRVQIPLILAWAMSIHKSQGQTLQRVKVDVGRSFERGQGK